MFTFIKKFFSSGVKDTLDGIGGLAKDIKTLVTGNLDPEKAAEFLEKFSELENALAKYQSSVISSEASGNWLQRSWRPITMLSFLILVYLNQFDLLTIPLTDEIWGLFKVGLGGYIGGRTIEKAVGIIKNT
jgi:hypothetical protein